MVYVQSKDGKVLMPTDRGGKVRRMLRDGLAVVVCKDPFTIRLTYESEEFVQYDKLPLDVPFGSFELRDFKKENEERKYLSQCKRQYGIPNNANHRKKEGRYKKTRKVNKNKNKVNTSNITPSITPSPKPSANNVKPDAGVNNSIGDM